MEGCCMEEDVLTCLKNATEPLRPGEIAELLGVDKKEVEKSIKKLKDADVVYSPKRCFYAAR